MVTEERIISGDTMADGLRQRSKAASAKDASLAEFANFHEGYIRHYISLADTKASVMLGLSSAFISYLFSKPVFHALLFDPTWKWTTWLAWVSTLLLVAGAGHAAWVIAPRLKTTGEGLVFFGSVRAYADAGAYADAVRNAMAGQLNDARLRHCYDVAGVCWSKYLYLRRAIWLSVAGFVMALPLLASF